MHLTISQPELSRLLQQASRALPGKTTNQLPILKFVHLAAADGAVQVTATDLTTRITATAACEIAEPGVLTVDGALFAEFVRGLPPAVPVTLAQEPSGRATRLTVDAGSSRARFATLPPDDFPTSPERPEDAVPLVIGGQELAAAINAVEKCAAKDDSRPVLAGINIKADGDRLILAAADGFKLGMTETTLPEPVRTPIEVIVPLAGARHLAAIAGEQSSPVELGLTKRASQLDATLFQARVTSSLIEGTFPDVRQIIPRECATTVVLDRLELMSAVRRCGVFAADNNRLLRLTVGDDRLDLWATAAERGDADAELDAVVAGDPLTIKVDGRYVADILASMDSERVEIGLNGPAMALVIRPDRVTTQTYVLMPMTGEN